MDNNACEECEVCGNPWLELRNCYCSDAGVGSHNQEYECPECKAVYYVSYSIKKRELVSEEK